MSVTNPQTPNERCRFDMFTVLRPSLVKNFPNKKPEWTYRGDKYTTEAPKALQNLIRMFINHGNKWQLLELYDNTRPKSDPDRIILKYKNGIIERNRLQDYFPMLENFPLPEFLKVQA
jgi:hypothetical protein